MVLKRGWSSAVIRVLTRADEIENLKQTLDDVRIQAKTEEIADHSTEAIAAASKEATIVFLPFRFKGNQILTPLGTEMRQMLDLLPMVALGLAAKEIDLDAEPEAGEAGEMAAVMDALEHARHRSRQAEAAFAQVEVEPSRGLAPGESAGSRAQKEDAWIIGNEFERSTES